ncbi:MAG: hypothetical protein ABI977_04965 [Acidobacteriota bacterium]
MSSKIVKQNLLSGLIAGVIALVIYVAISAFFHEGLSKAILFVGLLYGIGTLIITFLISRAVSVWKARR